MTAAPLVLTAGANLEEGFKEETHRQIASGGGLETFLTC
jgi:hypothetical protein